MRRLARSRRVVGRCSATASPIDRVITQRRFLPRYSFQFRRIQIMAAKPIKIPGPDHPISIDVNPSRVVVKVGGKIIADTSDAFTLREASSPPVQYIPRRDVDMAALTPTEHTPYSPYTLHASSSTIPPRGHPSPQPSS